MDDYEAEKSLKIASSALKSGDYEKARRFILKGIKLQPNSARAKSMLEECDSHVTASGNGAPRQESQRSREEEEIRSNRFAASQAKICDDILGKTDYYEILGVPKTASDDEIKKQYKKLALKLHPDKNHAPQATEAFKKLTQAFACLTDKNKRTVYDQHGTEQNFRQQYHQYFQDEETFDADDIFDMFFTGHVNPNRRRMRRQQFNQFRNGDVDPRPENNQAQWRGVLQLLPFLLILVCAVIFAGGNGENKQSYAELFSLDKEKPYVVSRETQNANVLYYVRKEFVQTVRGNRNILMEIEQEVEQLYLRSMADQCNYARREEQYLTRELDAAKSKKDQKRLKKKLKELNFDTCDEYTRVRNAL